MTSVAKNDWEHQACSAIENALEDADLDDVRGSILFPRDDFDDDDEEWPSRECKSIDDVVKYLTNLYFVYWYLSDINDDREIADYPDDADARVAEALYDTECEDFLREVREP